MGLWIGNGRMADCILSNMRKCSLVRAMIDKMERRMKCEATRRDVVPRISLAHLQPPLRVP